MLLVCCLYLDKAFCAVPVLRYLQEQTTLAAIVAAPLRGKAGSGRGTRALCQGRASYCSHHIFNSPEHAALRVPGRCHHGVRTLCRGRDGTCQAQHLPGTMVGVCRAAPPTTQAAYHPSCVSPKLRITQVRQR